MNKDKLKEQLEYYKSIKYGSIRRFEETHVGIGSIIEILEAILEEKPEPKKSK